jgi:hypothetical protein
MEFTMSDQQDDGQAPASDNQKRPAQQTDESSGGAIKQPQNARDMKRDLSQGAEPSTAGSSRRR